MSKSGRSGHGPEAEDWGSPVAVEDLDLGEILSDEGGDPDWGLAEPAFGAEATPAPLSHTLPGREAALHFSGAWSAPVNFVLLLPAHREEDPESQLVHMRHRMYDPRTGRFTQTDPIWGNRSTEHYTYVSGNPVSLIDPMGTQEASLDAGARETLEGNGYDPSKWRVGTPAEYNALVKSGHARQLEGQIFIFNGTIENHREVAESREKVNAWQAAETAAIRQDNRDRAEEYRDKVWNSLEPGQRVAKYLQNPNDPIIQDLWRGDPAAQEYFESIINSGAEMAGLVPSLLVDFVTGGAASVVREGVQVAGRSVLRSQAVRRGQSVLGHFPEYLQKAEAIGARRFNVPMHVWEKMAPAQRWAANKKFLDRLINRGDEVVLTTRVKDVQKGSTLEREIQYLRTKGYRETDGGTRMIPGD